MRVLLDFFRERPWQSIGLVLCMVLAASAEGIGVASLLPLISLMAPSSDAGDGSASRLKAFILGFMETIGVEPTLPNLLCLIAAAFALKNAVLLFTRRQIGFSIARIVRDLRLRLIRGLLRARWSYFVTRPVGSFGNAYGSEADRTAKAYFSAGMCVATTIQLMIYAAVALATSWRVTLVGLALGGAIMLALNGLVRMARRAGRRQGDLMYDVINSLTDVLQGVKPLKAMAREDLAEPWIESPTRKLERTWRKQVHAKEALTTLQETIFIAVICAGVYGLAAVAQLELGQIAVLGFAMTNAFNATSKLQRRYQEVVIDESAYALLRERIEDAERQRERLHGGEEPTLREGIELRQVDFTYGREPVLENLSLQIRAGEITALIGASGSGKTSIADLVAGLADPSSGEILVDGRNLASLDLTKWRQRIGYVPQDPFLLHDSIATNVSLGDPDLSAADVERALRSAHAWEFVEQLPNGQEAWVGERGSSLSGGQRQRIAIARALVHRPWLLILDEATTALDPESEAAVWQAMKELRGHTTILAISHQQALLMVADRVYRIQNEQAVEIHDREARSD